MRRLEVLELFAGGGGASQGLRAAGLLSTGHVEWSPHACATLRTAVQAGLLDGAVFEGDVRTVPLGRFAGLDVLWSSFPCQAFSQAGARKGALDARNGWPWTVARIDELEPTWLMGENVPGLLSHKKAAPHCLKNKAPVPAPTRSNTVRMVQPPERRHRIRQGSRPSGSRRREVVTFQTGGPLRRGASAPRRPAMRWVAAAEGLSDVPRTAWGAAMSCPGCYFESVILFQLGKRYRHVSWRVLDAADYGAPQRRRRVYIIAGPAPIEWPAPTHSQAALAWAKWGQGRRGNVEGGSYWSEHGLQPLGAPSRDELRALEQPIVGARWKTVRDALGAGGLGTLPVEGEVQVGGGNPHGKGRAHERNERNLTDEPALTVAACDAGNGGMFINRSRGGRLQMNYPLKDPKFHRGPSDAYRRHTINDPDQPSDALRLGGAAYVLETASGSIHTSIAQPHPPVAVDVVPAAPRKTPQSARVLDPDAPSTTLWGYDNRETPKLIDPRHPPVIPDQPAPAIRSGGDGHSAPPMWLQSGLVHTDGETRGNKRNVDEPSPAIGTKANMGMGGAQPGLLDRPAPTVTTTEAKGTRGHNMGRMLPSGIRAGNVDRASDALWLATGRRRLTPQECKVLMEWPAHWPVQGTITAQYMIAGNGCCPSVVEAIARAVIAAHHAG